MNTYEKIKDAILNKKQVTAMYHGFYREMCPHALGHKNGKEQALFYQFAGTGSQGAVIPNSDKNWRCITLEGLSNVQVRNGEWHTAHNHSTAQTCVGDIDVEVDLR